MNNPINQPARAADVARYIIDIHGPLPQMKLQKLLYYCQAASLASYDSPLYADRIKAWAGGPVVVSLWKAHPYESVIGSVPIAPGQSISRKPRTSIALKC